MNEWFKEIENKFNGIELDARLSFVEDSLQEGENIRPEDVTSYQVEEVICEALYSKARIHLVPSHKLSILQDEIKRLKNLLEVK